MWSNIYNQRVTILNKLKRADITGGTVDIWQKFTVDNAVWYEDSARNSGGNGVYIGTYITVLIPFNDAYMDYREWRHLPAEERAEKFTMSSGDYVVLGDVTEEIDASNIVSVMNDYGVQKCIVRHVKKPHKRFNATVQLKIEGV